MKIGAVFPHLEIGADPVVIRDWAQAAEEIGYSHLLVYDHVIGAVHEGREPALWGPYTEESLFHEIFVLFGFLAACTSRVELASGILILPQRQTVLVAKQAAEVDILSGERLRLGVGTGWNYVEYDSLNETFNNRGQRQVEQVEVLRKLWTEPVVSYEGKWHHIDRAGLKPLPRRQIPIWFGGFTDVVFKRAAEIGDGFIFGSGQEQNLEAMAQLQVYLETNGRKIGEDFGVEALLNYQSGPDQWANEISAWQAVGADYVSMRGMALRGQGEGLTSPQDHIDILSRYWEVAGEFSS
ncbi:MAG: LLM class F420-dependent oxidoreductase [Proteobacteria bacterium]|nr:LLM class F420-dependent oxidoreductase [Pseudomonadota bacterium]